MAFLLVGCQSSGPYVVRRGDTLYSIAHRNGLTVSELAARNHIRSPYTLQIGQYLNLRNDAVMPSRAGAVRTAPGIKAPGVADSQIKWSWPDAGTVINRFSLTGKVNKGIDIVGKPGATIKSAAAGVVVYAGNGLRGFGKLVIVKHNDRFLSAYGNCAKIYVKEGQRVTGGQALARLGSANDAAELLHFEIRRDGSPQNPLNYLPQPSSASL